MTMVPLREFTTTRAGDEAGSTSRFSITDRKATLSSGAAGARTSMDTASTARAVPWPMRPLMAAARRCAVVKSGALRFMTSAGALPKGLATVRSTVAPLGMRPAAWVLTVTLEPSAPWAPKPPRRRDPPADDRGRRGRDPPARDEKKRR